VTGSTLANTNQSASSATGGSSVNTPSRLYPSGAPTLTLKVRGSGSQQPHACAFANVDQISQHREAAEIPSAI
jgi:hypothetical protein